MVIIVIVILFHYIKWKKMQGYDNDRTQEIQRDTILDNQLFLDILVKRETKRRPKRIIIVFVQ